MILKYMEKFMLEALKEAEKARDKGEIPIGAVIEKDGVIIGRGQKQKKIQPRMPKLLL